MSLIHTYCRAPSPAYTYVYMHIYNTLHAFFFFFFSFFHKKIVFRSEDSEEAKELTQLDDAVDKEEVLNLTQF